MASVAAKNILPCDGEAYYYSSFIPAADSTSIYHQLLEEISWEEKSIKIFGRELLQPRKIAWYGDDQISYTYSNLRQIAKPWTPLLSSIKNQIQEFTGREFNSVLLNLYRSDRDSMGWHSDNEKELGENPFIASLSFGHPRIFQLKHMSRELKTSLLLENGSLLLMGGSIQHHWKHQLPKRRALCGPRMNLTFRKVFAI